MSSPQAGAIKNRVLKALSKLPNDDPRFSNIYKELVGGPLGDRISNFVKTRGYKDAIGEITYLMKTIPTLGSVDELKPFLQKIRDKVDFVNIEELVPQSGMSEPRALAECVDDPMAKELFNRIAVELKGKADAGPGEAALAILSPDITYAPDDAELGRGGDISIRGAKVEVKGNLGRIWGPFPINQGPMTEILKNFNPTLKAVTVVQASKPLPEGFPKEEFITEASKAWFGKPLKSLINTFGTDKFIAQWLRVVFNYYKREANHQGILIIGRKTYQYITDGSQMMNVKLKNRGDLCRPGSAQFRELAPQVIMA